jgi:hypothetical protein
LPEQTPLATISPDSISQLFAIDPEYMTDADIDQLVVAYRAQRQHWATEDAKPKAPRGKKAAAEKAPKVPVNINLDDLLGSI